MKYNIEKRTAKFDVIFLISAIFILCLFFITLNKCRAQGRVKVQASVDPTLTFSLNSSYLYAETNEDSGYYIAFEEGDDLESLRTVSNRGKTIISLKADLAEVTYLCLSIF